MKNGIVVVFPGTGYTCKEKQLQECTQKYAYLGYDIINLDFSSVQYSNISTLKKAVEKTNQIIANQIKGITFEDYKDVVFISKSLGTVCANCLENTLNIKPRQLYLTPLKETIDGVKAASRVICMIIGTEDKHLDSKLMKSFCIERNIPYLVINGVGHNLKADGDESKTNDIIKKIVKFCDIDY